MDGMELAADAVGFDKSASNESRCSLFAPAALWSYIVELRYPGQSFLRNLFFHAVQSSKLFARIVLTIHLASPLLKTRPP
eukprot:3863284-Pleurochrysis_carterae.AAC.1